MSRTGPRYRRKTIWLAHFQDDLCFYCENPLKFLEPSPTYEGDDGNDADYASIDHIVPRTEGGTNAIANLVVACRQCNSVKGKRPITEEDIIKLAELNSKRDLTGRHGIIFPDTFMSDPTEAAFYLCDILLENPGLRRSLIKPIIDTHIATKAIADVKDITFRCSLIELWRKNKVLARQRETEYDSVVDNIVTTLIRRAKSKWTQSSEKG